jgi:putative ABC transport system substrate-binding protein
MRRRDFITLLGGAVAWPFAARAQLPARLPVIGFLSSGSANSESLAPFHQGLSEAGYVEGRNVAIEYRFANDRYDRLPALAAELASRRIAVIATSGGSPPARAAKAATATIPIVFTGNFDPVELGLVASLNRPGGNVTGVSGLGVEVTPKRLELIHELVPSAASFAVLANPTNAGSQSVLRRLQEAAGTLGVELKILHASAERDFETAFAALPGLRTGGLVIAADPFFNTRSAELASLALRHGIPAVYQYHEFAAAGGVMSYGSDPTAGLRSLGAYAGRILKGEKPAELPVQQTTKIELIVNLNTARSLGLTVPLPLVGRADEVIE